MKNNNQRKKMTYLDIVNETGISLGTISRYFNNGSISKEKKAILDKYVKENNYRPNVGAQIIRGYEKCVYIIIPELSYDLTTGSLVSSISEFLRKKNIYSYIVEGSTDVDVFIDVIEKTLERKPKNTIIMPPTINKKLNDYLSSVEENIIVYGYSIENKKSIIFDEYEAFNTLTKKIIDEYGNQKKLIYVGLDDKKTFMGSERYKGFIDAVKNNELYNQSFLIKENTFEHLKSTWKDIAKIIDSNCIVICGTHTIFQATYLAKQILGIDFMITDILFDDAFKEFKSYDYKIEFDLNKIIIAIYNMMYSNKNETVKISFDVCKR